MAQVDGRKGVGADGFPIGAIINEHKARHGEMQSLSGRRSVEIAIIFLCSCQSLRLSQYLGNETDQKACAVAQH